MSTRRNVKGAKKTNTYQKEPQEYIQGQINKIRNSIEERQSWIARLKVNEVTRNYVDAKT